jgi:hypothetical protein
MTAFIKLDKAVNELVIVIAAATALGQLTTAADIAIYYIASQNYSKSSTLSNMTLKLISWGSAELRCRMNLKMYNLALTSGPKLHLIYTLNANTEISLVETQFQRNFFVI